MGILGGISFGSSNSQGGAAFAYYGPSNELDFDVYSATSRYTVIVSSAFALLSGTHHWSLQYDGSALKIYRDGIVLNSKTIGAITVSSVNSPNLYVGRTYGALYENGSGWIDELVIINRALSDSEIRGLYLAKELPKQYTLVDYQLSQMASDSVITPQEKTTALSRWGEIYNDSAATVTLPVAPTVSGSYKTLRDQANGIGIWTPTTTGTPAKAYYDAVEALRAYQ